MTTYPGMNQQLCQILRISEVAASRYAADRIEELEQQLALAMDCQCACHKIPDHMTEQDRAAERVILYEELKKLQTQLDLMDQMATDKNNLSLALTEYRAKLAIVADELCEATNQVQLLQVECDTLQKQRADWKALHGQMVENQIVWHPLRGGLIGNKCLSMVIGPCSDAMIKRGWEEK